MSTVHPKVCQPDYRERLEMAVNEKIKSVVESNQPTVGDKWGPWVYTRRLTTLEHEVTGYELPLDELMLSEQQRLHWVDHMSRKQWLSPAELRQLIYAIDDILGLTVWHFDAVTSGDGETAMTTEEQMQTASEPASVHLVARNPNEMALAKTSLTLWLQQKIQQCDTEADELGESAETALTNGWQHETLRRHCNLAKRRGDFYRKTLSAVDAGYTIVPNFPIDLFAIRVKREHPKHDDSTSTYSLDSAMRGAAAIQPATLPEGEGRYVSPTPAGRTGAHQETKDGKELTRYSFTTTDFTDIVFPIEAARPEVMSAAAEAMALRCFDAIGICPQSRRGDPLIIGQVLGPKVGHTQKAISFLIAWHLDLRTL